MGSLWIPLFRYKSSAVYASVSAGQPRSSLNILLISADIDSALLNPDSLLGEHIEPALGSDPVIPPCQENSFADIIHDKYGITFKRYGLFVKGVHITEMALLA